MADLHRDWREWLSTLLSKNVRFVLVGAHAVGAHAEPRYTGGLDVFVDRSPANAERLMAALRVFGFGDVDLSVEDLQRPDYVVMLGRPPVRIDILTGISGVDFARAWKNRVIADVAGLDIPIIGREDLLTNKRAAGRPKDLADIALLEATRAADLD